MFVDESDATAGEGAATTAPSKAPISSELMALAVAQLNHQLANLTRTKESIVRANGFVMKQAAAGLGKRMVQVIAERISRVWLQSSLASRSQPLPIEFVADFCCLPVPICYSLTV